MRFHSIKRWWNLFTNKNNLKLLSIKIYCHKFPRILSKLKLPFLIYSFDVGGIRDEGVGPRVSIGDRWIYGDGDRNICYDLVNDQYLFPSILKGSHS